VTAVPRARNRWRTPVISGIAIALASTASAYARDRAPGAPGDPAAFAAADKHGFGTSATRASKVWFTLRARELTEVFYPDLGHPSVRDLTFVVGDEGESSGKAKVERIDGALAFRQTVEKAGRWRLTKTYVTDPARATALVRVNLTSLDGKARRLTLRLDPQLFGDGDDDVAWSRDRALLAHDRHIASALVAKPSLGRTSSGYAGHDNDLLAHDYDALRPGNVVQAARTRVNGLAGHRDLTLALSFGARATPALEAARASLKAGFAALERSYAAGWARYRARLKSAPASVAAAPQVYETSVLTLKASEDKANPGAFVASPTRPWGLNYGVVRIRDLYAVATAELAAGDAAAAGRALGFMLAAQTGTSRVDGRPLGEDAALDEVALPVVLAWQLGRFDATTWKRVRQLADQLAEDGPKTTDRWGGEAGYSAAALAAEVAALVCAADLAVRNGDGTRASSYTRLADEWAKSAQAWTAPDFTGAKKALDAGFLELVRLGVVPAGDAAITAALAKADAKLGGHRFDGDTYGEQRGGGPFEDGADTLGRIWPLLAGERGEYELAAGRPATAQLAAMTAAANDGGMLPEQVWDGRPPSRRPGGGTRSATPHAWTHAQLIRLAWSIDAGRPIERPGIVACRYTGVCT
jgi:glucoamylase